MFNDCALGARILYGTEIYVITLSAFLLGYRQISLANTIQNIVISGDLVAEKMRKRSDMYFGILITILSLYYIAFLLSAFLLED